MALYERMDPPRWKPVRNYPGYEISEEGQVRITERLNHGQYAGKIKQRFWMYWSRKNRQNWIDEHEWEHADTHGSLYVRLSYNGKKKNLRVADLLSEHWPDAHVPDHWTASSSTSSLEEDDREVLTDQERIAILKSPMYDTRIARCYDIAKSSVYLIRTGKNVFARRWLEENPEYKRGWRPAEKATA